MSATMTASVILVQLDGGDKITAFVAYGPEDGDRDANRQEIQLPAPQEATDDTDWLRQVVASLVEAL